MKNTNNIKGGEAIASGGFGCVFSPSLKCKGTKKRDKNKISKLMTKKHAIQEYKEKEDWLSDGSLEVILNIPVGITMDFYDRLNKITHGSALTSEVKE